MAEQTNQSKQLVKSEEQQSNNKNVNIFVTNNLTQINENHLTNVEFANGETNTFYDYKQTFRVEAPNVIIKPVEYVTIDANGKKQVNK